MHVPVHVHVPVLVHACACTCGPRRTPAEGARAGLGPKPLRDESPNRTEGPRCRASVEKGAGQPQALVWRIGLGVPQWRGSLEVGETVNLSGTLRSKRGRGYLKKGYIWAGPGHERGSASSPATRGRGMRCVGKVTSYFGVL